MRYSILSVAVLILVSGFIAYFGDLLGRKMGKKRLTILNLRPRHTAIVFTTITGMLISALVLTTLVSVNSQFRKVLTQGEQILQKNKDLSFANIKLENRNSALVKRSKYLEAQVAVQQAEVLKARNETAKAEKARDAAVASVKRLEQEITQRQKELDSFKKRTDIAESELKKRNVELAAIQSDLVSAKKALANAQVVLASAEKKRLTAQSRLADTQSQLNEVEKQLKVKLDEIADKQKQIDELQGQRTEFYFQMRYGDIILRQGAELTRKVIKGKQSKDGIRDDLVALLSSAGAIAQKLGAMQGGNGNAVRLMYFNREQSVLINDENQCMNMAVDLVSRSLEDVVVQVVCAKNCVAGEQVTVELRPHVNFKVYGDGQLISTAKINGQQSEGRILLALINFLKLDVSEAALRAGIVPVSNPSPEEAIGQNQQEQVDALMKVVDQIKAKDSVVKIEAYADKDIYAAGPLNMENMRFGISKAD